MMLYEMVTGLMLMNLLIAILSTAHAQVASDIQQEYALSTTQEILKYQVSASEAVRVHA